MEYIKGQTMVPMKGKETAARTITVQRSAVKISIMKVDITVGYLNLW